MTNQLEMVNDVLQLMSDADQATYDALQAAAPALQALQQLLSASMAALTESDKTMLRVQEAVSLGTTTWTTADVVAWVTYRRALRAIISTKSGSLPSKPAYPVNT